MNMQCKLIAMRTIFYHFAIHKLPNLPEQDQGEVCLALLGSLHKLRLGFSSVWLKEHSQLTVFNRDNSILFVQNGCQVEARGK